MMRLTVTVTRELTRDLDSKEVETTDLNAALEELALECAGHGTIVDVQKDQRVG